MKNLNQSKEIIREAFQAYVNEINARLAKERSGGCYAFALCAKRKFNCISGIHGRDRAEGLIASLNSADTMLELLRAVAEPKWGSSSKTIISRCLVEIFDDRFYSNFLIFSSDFNWLESFKSVVGSLNETSDLARGIKREIKSSHALWERFQPDFTTSQFRGAHSLNAPLITEPFEPRHFR